MTIIVVSIITVTITGFSWRVGELAWYCDLIISIECHSAFQFCESRQQTFKIIILAKPIVLSVLIIAEQAEHASATLDSDWSREQAPFYTERKRFI